MTDTIRAALEAAEREPTTAGKIAAFLRALPVHINGNVAMFTPGELAAAVDAAAKEAGE